MSYLLQEPTTALLVGDPDRLPDDVRSGVLSGTATAVDVASSVEQAREVLAEREDVGCILLVDPGDDRSVSEACDALHEEAPDVPVIAYVDEALSSVATDLASRTHCRCLPRDASPGAVREAVDDALQAYDRRRREAAESSLFRTLLDQAEVPLFAKDDEGRHLYKSGLTSDESLSDVVGKTDVEIADPGREATARVAYEDDLELLETGEGIYEKEEQADSGDGEYWSLVTKVPWRDDDGEIQGLVGLAYDITRWKERERRLEAQQRRVDQFASYLQHDLRTPLQVAYGALELAREGDQDALDKIERAHERMVEVIEDLSTLSGSDPSSRLSDEVYDAVGLDIKSVYLGSMIEDLWTVYGPPEATLSLDLPADTVVIARSETVRPLVENLLKNAIEHGGSDVTVRVGTTTDRGFFIEDDGPGLPAELATAITEQNVPATKKAAGTGLLIVLDAVEELRGNIRAGESENGGARIEVGECNLINGTPMDAAPADAIDVSANTDVGPVPVPGTANFDPDSNQWHVTGAGENIWGNTNEFHFVYGTASAPVRIEGRIDKLDGVHEYSKAGLTVRAGLDEDAPFGYVGTTESHGSEVTWRLSTDGHTNSDQFEERALAFQWYRVDYVDDEVTCYLSEDGEEWHAVDQRSIDLGEDVYVGMLVSSHDAERACVATFRDVRAWELNPL